MRDFDGLASLKATLYPALRCWILLAIGLFSSSFALAQSAPAKAGATAASSSGGDFSIETEMLTYSALESNSEAVACDVAAYVNKTSANFSNPPAGTVCSVNAGNTAATVLILPFDRSEFSDFQIWRADMAAMSQLRTRAEVSFQCPKGARTRGATASTAGSIAASLSPYGAMAETALGMMATEESATSVVGTIQDQALMDGVARQLRSLRVKVLMPSAYTSFGFIADDEAHSPFMTNLDKLIDARACLADLAATDDAKDKAGQNRDGQGKEENARIEREVNRSVGQERRAKRPEKFAAPEGNQKSCQTADKREQGAFRQKLADQAKTAGTKRRAQGELFFAFGRLGKQEIR